MAIIFQDADWAKLTVIQKKGTKDYNSMLLYITHIYCLKLTDKQLYGRFNSTSVAAKRQPKKGRIHLEESFLNHQLSSWQKLQLLLPDKCWK